MLFAAAPGYGLMMPLVPLMWAAASAGHEVRLATTSRMCTVAADAGLQVVDVCPDRDTWAELMTTARSNPGGPPRSPFRLFTETMTAGTVEAGRELDAEVVVTTSDHHAGILAAAALHRPALEVGNRISWSTRDSATQDRMAGFGGGPEARAQLGIPAEGPELIARIDPRAPSMGGLTADEPDPRDGVPWWAMRYVPFNGGAVIEPWVRERPSRPRVVVTLGTVVPTVAGTDVVAVLLAALADLDVEVVLALGDSDLDSLGELPSNVRAVGFLPLSAVLPTTTLIVHHGGSGTTAAPLHFGVPQVVLPSFADNPMSAERVVARGVGVSHDPTTLDADTARGLVTQVLDDPSYATAAAEVAAELATQPSPGRIVTRVEEWMAR
ncbi:glycosyltransferase [Microlunatus kandeliicorticis]|nr:glycosyltransferase [Microlunatus kandeliicorticis]